MLPSEKPEFAELITQALAFWRRDVTDFTLSVWWEACKPFSIDQVNTALQAHAMHPERSGFPPMPGDFVRELAGTHTDRALMAWGRVSRAMAGVGAYASVDFADAAIHATIRELGGWALICRVPSDEQQFLQKRFCDFYRTYSTRGAPDAPLQLQGEHDSTNATLSLESPNAAKRLAAAVTTPAVRIG